MSDCPILPLIGSIDLIETLIVVNNGLGIAKPPKGLLLRLAFRTQDWAGICALHGLGKVSHIVLRYVHVKELPKGEGVAETGGRTWSGDGHWTRLHSRACSLEHQSAILPVLIMNISSWTRLLRTGLRASRRPCPRLDLTRVLCVVLLSERSPERSLKVAPAILGKENGLSLV